MQLAPEVSHAIIPRGPVVALESTIIAHGLPWPQYYGVTANRALALNDARVATQIAVAYSRRREAAGISETCWRDDGYRPRSRAALPP